ncbi:flagellar assembly protein FliH [Nitrosovibrio tenuis]|uniref:Flagellar assembly protein FliH n=1 Tax=Nitrosovibrio tenuis TaxID=1233 RepID=A0A1H7J3E4_9PROT|nr:flagellar assembly protein FliH [Nitrosovibrio tenuis]SEK69271.1 flagellar assembly protein FliH [Nitrosovibrio tenuis]
MASRIIPKERLSSYQRWKMDAFEGEQPRVPEPGVERLWSGRAGMKRDSSAGQAGAQHLHEQIEQAHQQAKHEGYAAGHEAGQEAGYEAGYKVGHNAGYQAGYKAGGDHAAAEVIKLEALLQSFQKELAIADQAIGSDLLILALSLAKQMTREALRIKPELMVAVVRECLQQEFAFGQPAQIFLHTEDAALVRQYLNQELDGWTICIDSKLERGGCRIKMGHSQTDATVTTRWQRICQALGQNGTWLE